MIMRCKIVGPMGKFSITIGTCLYSILISLALGSCNHADGNSRVMNIAVASNVFHPIREIALEYEKQTGISSKIVQGSSGKLTSQIKQGAPFNVFVSADTAYTWSLYADSLTLERPMRYASGKLMLWSLNHTLDKGLESLQSGSIRSVAIANPKTAPYGIASEQILVNSDLYETIYPKLVFGESIGQTNQFILSGSADAGFTSYSSLFTPGLDVKGIYWVVPDSFHHPIHQNAVAIRRNLLDEQSMDFVHYLRSDESRQTLEKFGYTVSYQ